MEDRKEIPSQPGYAATGQGHIVSLARSVSRGTGTYRVQERQLKESPHPDDGRLMVGVSQRGRTRALMVHKLVAEAFHGGRPDGLEIRHRNGNAQDNRPSNLTYGTHSENELDKLEHGTNPNANKTHCPAGHDYSEHGRYRPQWNDRVCKRCRYDAERARLGRKRRARD